MIAKSKSHNDNRPSRTSSFSPNTLCALLIAPTYCSYMSPQNVAHCFISSAAHVSTLSARQSATAVNLLTVLEDWTFSGAAVSVFHDITITSQSWPAILACLYYIGVTANKQPQRELRVQCIPHGIVEAPFPTLLVRSPGTQQSWAL